MLLQAQQTGESTTKPETTGSVEELRLILAARQQDVSYDEAGEIADALVEFYEVLAEEVEHEADV